MALVVSSQFKLVKKLKTYEDSEEQLGLLQRPSTASKSKNWRTADEGALRFDIDRESTVEELCMNAHARGSM